MLLAWQVTGAGVEERRRAELVELEDRWKDKMKQVTQP